jgi:hypothetical protein
MSTKANHPIRPTLTREQLEKMTAYEIGNMKLSDEETIVLRAINDERMKERLATVELIRIEMAPVHAELEAAGVTQRELSDSHGKSPKYPTAIPILLKHLQMPYSDAIKDSIARTLAVPLPEVRKAWPILVHEYLKAPMGTGCIAVGDTRQYRLGAKDGLAVALSMAATEATLPELIELVSDPANGDSRILLLYALRKSKSEIARQAVARLASDPVLTREIASWKKR